MHSLVLKVDVLPTVHHRLELGLVDLVLPKVIKHISTSFNGVHRYFAIHYIFTIYIYPVLLFLTYIQTY